MRKKEVDRMFIEHVMPDIRLYEQEYKHKRFSKDRPLRSEAYNNFIDSLQREGSITNRQAAAYCIPQHLIR
jgi:hypothetical protein